MNSERSLRISSWQGDLPAVCHPHFLPQAKEILWPEKVEERAEIAVVGAGLSGLTAAYHLRDRETVVLEAGEIPGGVCQGGSYQGVKYPAGSAYFYYPWDESWQAWYRELGLPVDEALISGPVSALFHEGRWYPDCFTLDGLRTLPLPVAAREGLIKLAADLASWEERWEPLGSSVLSQPELDRISLAHYLEQYRGLPPEATLFLDSYCRSCLGAGPDAVSAWAGVFFLMSEFSPTSRTAAFPEGNTRLVEALLRALPRPPRPRQIVVRLEPKARGLHLLIWNDLEKRPYRLEAGTVVLAVGKFVARHLLPPESGWRLDDLARFRYSSYLVAALCGRITIKAPGYENWVMGEEAFSDFVISPRLPRSGGRVMTVFAPQPFPQGRDPLMRARPKDKARELLGAVERLFPGTIKEVEEVRLHRFGHAQVVPYPGFLTFLKGDFPKQQGRIILAHSDLEGVPCVEAAIVQGQQAARRVRETLGL